MTNQHKKYSGCLFGDSATTTLLAMSAPPPPETEAKPGARPEALAWGTGDEVLASVCGGSGPVDDGGQDGGDRSEEEDHEEQRRVRKKAMLAKGPKRHEYGSVMPHLTKSRGLVNFDLVWPRVGYSRRDAAVRTLRQSFIKNHDYMVTEMKRGAEGVGEEPTKGKGPGSRGGLPKNLVWVTREALRRFVQENSPRTRGSDKGVVPPSPEEDPLIDLCDVMRIFVVRPPETDSLNMLSAVCRSFGGVQQFPVRGRAYRIDLYFPEQRLAVECDEDHHSSAEAQARDRRREEAIRGILGCDFYRFNPDHSEYRFSEMAGDVVALLTERSGKEGGARARSRSRDSEPARGSDRAAPDSRSPGSPRSA